MKRVLLILLVAFSAYSQGINTYMGGDGFSYSKIGTSTPAVWTLTNPARWSDTTFPISPYSSGFMRFTTGRDVMLTGHDKFFGIVYNITNSWQITIRWKAGLDILAKPIAGSSGDANWSIGVYTAVGGQISMYKEGGAVFWNVPWTYGDTTFHTMTWVGINSTTDTVRTYLDSVLVNTYTGANASFGNSGVQTGDAGFCLGGKTELVGDGSYTSLYAFSHATIYADISDFAYARNDTMYWYNMNQGNQSAIIPRKFIKTAGVWVEQYPYNAYEFVGATSIMTQDTKVLQNGAGLGKDTMKAKLYVSGIKSNYRDCYAPMKQGLTGYSFGNGYPYGSYMGEAFVKNDTLWVCGDFNKADSLRIPTGATDTIYGVARWDGSAFQRVGYGLKTTSVGAGVMYIFPHNNSIMATGYFMYARGNGDTVNHVAEFRDGEWHKMGTGFSAEGFSGVSAYGIAYFGFNGVTAGGKTVNSFARWNGSTWDSARGGLSSLPMCVVPDSSSGERLVVLGGGFGAYIQGGIATNWRSIIAWSEDSLKYKTWHNLRCVGASSSVNKIVYNSTDGWWYIAGYFDKITDGVDTTTSTSLVRYKVGTGLQSMGTGVIYGTGWGDITSLCMLNNILYFGGSTSRVNNFLSKNIGAINLTTGTVIDMGYTPNDFRPELATVYGTKIVFGGDMFNVNGHTQREGYNGVTLYDPALNP